MTPGLLHDLAFVGGQCAARGCVVVPAALSLMLCAIDCDALRQFDRISPSAVHVKMQPILAFAVRSFEDVQLSTTPHIAATPAVHGATIGLQAVVGAGNAGVAAVTVVVDMPVIAAASVNAIAYWFRAHGGDAGEPQLDTAPSADSHWKQAAVLLGADVAVSVGGTVQVEVVVGSDGRVDLKIVQYR